MKEMSTSITTKKETKTKSKTKNVGDIAEKYSLSNQQLMKMMQKQPVNCGSQYFITAFTNV